MLVLGKGWMLVVILVTEPSNPFLFMYAQSSTEQRLLTKEVTGSRMTATGMINEQVPTVWETEVFLGTARPPQGYVVYRYANGTDYSGYMVHGIREGYGVLRGPVISYIGLWRNDHIAEGIMVDTVRGAEFQLPLGGSSREPQRPPDPQ